MSDLWGLLVDEVRGECRRDVARFGGRFVEAPGVLGAIGCPRPLGCFVHGAEADLDWLLAQPGLAPPLLMTDAHPARDALVTAGWSVHENLTSMVLRDRGSLVPAAAPASFTIESVPIPEGISEFHDAMERGFEGPPGQAASWLPRDLLTTERPRLMLAREGRRAVGTAAARQRIRGGVLFAISVDPEHRGAGLGAALTAAAAASSFDAGAQFVTLHATAAGTEVYERVGFQVAGTVTSYGRPNAGAGHT